jgi:hypothetical protein
VKLSPAATPRLAARFHPPIEKLVLTVAEPPLPPAGFNLLVKRLRLSVARFDLEIEKRHLPVAQSHLSVGKWLRAVDL